MNKITLSLSLNEAKILYEQASLERRLELEELFPELKPQSITDRVKTYEDALKVLKRNHFDENNLYPREKARRKLEIIIEALNEGWKPDWKNCHQKKWHPCFSGSGAGLRCSISYYSLTYAFADIGVRLCCKDEKTADYVGNQFLDLYKEMVLG